MVPIPGTTKRNRLGENCAAASLSLSAGELQELSAAAAGIPVQGARYSEAAQRMINR
jgi:aryl-alcohol dehydrogenase-like predicted oxidoreductase